jgi:hypothetical protein
MSCDDEVQIIEAPWEDLVKRGEDYKVAYDIFSNKKFGSPTINTMRELLQAFADTPSEQWFIPDSQQALEFEKIRAGIVTTCSAAISTRDKTWTKKFVADLFAKLL